MLIGELGKRDLAVKNSINHVSFYQQFNIVIFLLVTLWLNTTIRFYSCLVVQYDCKFPGWNIKAHPTKQSYVNNRHEIETDLLLTRFGQNVEEVIQSSSCCNNNRSRNKNSSRPTTRSSSRPTTRATAHSYVSQQYDCKFQ